MEHVAGLGCICGKEYSGYRILVGEMKGCQDIQCLLMKDDRRMPEPDDQPSELDSYQLLTGIGDGFPHDEPLRDLMPVIHGIDEIWVDNGACDASILPKCTFQKALALS